MQLLFAACLLSARVGAYRVSLGLEDCGCTETGIINGVDTRRAGCAVHFGQRFGYVCYVAGGGTCTLAKESKSHPGLWWRSCAAEHREEEGKKYLLQSMEGIDIADIETNIRIAKTKGVDQATLDAAAQRIETIHHMEAARDELTAAVKTSDYHRLKKALEAAEELELDAFLSEETLEHAVERFNFLSRRRDATHALLRGIQGEDLDQLDAQLATATDLGADQEVLSQGRERIRQLTAMRDSVVALEAAIAGRSRQQLSEALAQCQTLGALKPDLQSRAAARKAELEEMEDAADELIGLLGSDDGPAVMRAVQRAKDAGVDEDLIKQGEETKSLINLRKREVHDRLSYLTYQSRPSEKEEMQNLIDEAKRLEASNGWEIHKAEIRLQTLR